MIPITDREAAQILDVRYETIRNAVKRGALIRVPGTGLVQHVAKEQVELFKGKTQVKLGSLSPDELAVWQRIRNEIVTPQPAASRQAESEVPEGKNFTRKFPLTSEQIAAMIQEGGAYLLLPISA